MKIDGDCILHTRPNVGVGYQIDGFLDFKSAIIKSKLNKEWVPPIELNLRKVFYKFYRGKDKNGIDREYVYLAARTNDDPYSGHRVVCFSKGKGVTLILEPWRRKEIEDMKNYFEHVQPKFGETKYQAIKRIDMEADEGERA